MSEQPYQSARDKLIRAQAGDARAREELIRDNLALVKYIVKRFSDRFGIPYFPCRFPILRNNRMFKRILGNQIPSDRLMKGTPHHLDDLLDVRIAQIFSLRFANRR